MNRRIRLAIPVAVICTLLARGARSQTFRIGPAGIYPDPARTPGAANPEVTDQNTNGASPQPDEHMRT